MFSFLSRLGSGLAIFLIAYWAYALMAVPWIEPFVTLQQRERAEQRPDAAPPATSARHRQALRQLLPSDAWELDNPKVLETEQAVLLFQDYQPQDDQQTIRLQPVTLILYTAARAEDEGRGRAVVVQASDGAMLNFDETMDLSRAKIGKLLGGRLLGEVTLRSPETQPGANDRIEMVTRGVQIDPQRIWTPHDVRFQFGLNEARGRDLSIRFGRGDMAGSKPDSQQLGSLRLLELLKVDYVRLHLQDDLIPRRSGRSLDSTMGDPVAGDAAAGDAVAGDAVVATGSPATTLRGPHAPVEITCRGPFQFDFAGHAASFEEQVRVVRPTPDGAVDQLQCQLLAVHFRQREAIGTHGASGSTRTQVGDASPGTPDPQADERQKHGVRALDVSRLVAKGAPAALQAPSVDAEARGELLELDFITNRIRMDGAPMATFRHGRYQLEAPQLEYELHEDPKRLGQLWAIGAGQFRTLSHASPVAASGQGLTRRLPRPEEKERHLQAVWKKELQLRPYKGNHVISLYEGAEIAAAGSGSMAADEIHLYMLEVPREDQRRYDVVPDKLLALGRVHLDSRQLSGATQRVEVWFRREPAAVGGGVATSSSGDGLPGGVLAGREPPSHSLQKFDVTGKKIFVQVAQVGSETVVENVTVDEDVRVVELVSDDQRATGFDIQGQTLELNNVSGTDVQVQVRGEPARVLARQLALAGAQIQLSQQDNRLWIEGGGELTLRAPSAAPAMPQAVTTVRWAGGMRFNGLQARFERDVQVQAQQPMKDGHLLEMSGRGELLEIFLTQQLDFDNPRHSKDVDVRQLAFGGEVYMQNREFSADGLQQSFEQMQVRDLVIDRLTGQIHGHGPGWVSSVRYGNSSPLSPSKPPAANSVPVSTTAGSSKPTPPRLMYLRVDFQRELIGNLHHRQAEFLERVVASYGPVTRWTDSLQPRSVKDLRKDDILLNCDQLGVAEMPLDSGSGERSVELEATGNTVVEGQAFTARGRRISYADGKDLLVLEGDSRNDAELQGRAPAGGGDPPLLRSRTIKYWPGTGTFEMNGFRSVDLQPAGFRPQGPGSSSQAPGPR